MIHLDVMKRRDVPAAADGVTWVYVISAGVKPVACKIGIAVDLYRRLKRTAYSFKKRHYPVSLYCAYALKSGAPRHAERVEAEIQHRLSGWAFGVTAGDWFLVPPSDGELALCEVLRDWKIVDARRFPGWSPP